MKKNLIYVSCGLFLVLAGVGLGILSSSHSSVASSGQQEEKQRWTCSMHPSIIMDRPGKCPICHMDLIKVDKLHHESPSNEVNLSDSAKKLLQVQTSEVERRNIVFPLTLVGNIEYDETRTAMISAHFDGRVKKLFLNYVGAPVKKGQEIALFFSPDLVLLQREMQIAMRDLDRANSEYEIKKAEQQLTSTKSKIESWQFDPKRVEKIVKDKGPTPVMPFSAPISGVVTVKNIVEGQYFKRGDKLLTIADTSVMWAVLEAYESDLPWLRYGQRVKITAEALPGLEFDGMIAYIAPEVDKMTRTVRIRANVPNPTGELRAGMFIKATVKVEVGGGGKPTLASLAGKWISPMHPEVIKDHSGTCDVCGMQLVPVSSLDKTTPLDKRPPLIVPDTAVLFTGKRSLVYVQTGIGKYEPRQIMLGPRAGNYYIVEAGLKAGEKVVTNGSFQIDSTAQLNRTESMMNPVDHDIKADQSEMKQNISGREIPDTLLDAYFKVWKALAGDNLNAASEAAAKLAAVSKSDQAINDPANRLAAEKDIERARADFRIISDAMAKILNRGNLKNPVYKMHCPMAFNNQGAFWFQNEKGVLNPYYGDAMLECGSLIDTVKPDAKKEHKHAE